LVGAGHQYSTEKNPAIARQRTLVTLTLSLLDVQVTLLAFDAESPVGPFALVAICVHPPSLVVRLYSVTVPASETSRKSIADAVVVETGVKDESTVRYVVPSWIVKRRGLLCP
jgi:hypothetical protein